MNKSKILSWLSAISAGFLIASSLVPFIKQAEAVVISNLQVTSVTNTSATISWNTDVPADSLVEFGVGGVYMDAVDETDLKTAHSLILLGLQPGTQYTYKASSAESSGEVAYAEEGMFTTTGSASASTPAPSSAVTVTPPPSDEAIAPSPTTSVLEGLPMSAIETPTASESAGLQIPAILESPSSSESGDFTPVNPTGTLAKEGGTIYFLMARDEVKVPFTSMKAFLGLGYNLKNVKQMDLSGYKLATGYFLSDPNQEHPWGSCLVWKDGTVYYHTTEGMAGVPSMEVAESIGCTQDKIVPMNASDDKIWEQNPNLPVMQVGDIREL